MIDSVWEDDVVTIETSADRLYGRAFVIGQNEPITIGRQPGKYGPHGELRTDGIVYPALVQLAANNWQQMARDVARAARVFGRVRVINLETTEDGDTYDWTEEV